jgi:hypothetical protein
MYWDLILFYVICFVGLFFFSIMMYHVLIEGTLFAVNSNAQAVFTVRFKAF